MVRIPNAALNHPRRTTERRRLPAMHPLVSLWFHVFYPRAHHRGEGQPSSTKGCAGEQWRRGGVAPEDIVVAGEFDEGIRQIGVRSVSASTETTSAWISSTRCCSRTVITVCAASCCLRVACGVISKPDGGSRRRVEPGPFPRAHLERVH